MIYLTKPLNGLTQFFSSVDFENVILTSLALNVSTLYCYNTEEVFMEDLVAYYDDSYIIKSLIHIDIDNLGFTRGYGVYECFRSYEGFTFKIKDHVNRLKKNCKKMLIKFPKADIEEIIKNLIEKNGEKNLIFRLYVIDHPSEEKTLLTILCNTESFFKDSHPNRAISVQPYIDKRKDIFIKSTGYSESMIALKKAQKNGLQYFAHITVIEFQKKSAAPKVK